MGKTLSPEQQGDVQRLKKLWDAKRQELGLTQANVAERFGIKNQTAISQYLNGRIPLNMEATAKFAKVLQVAIHEISPRHGEWVYKPLPTCVKASLEPFFSDGNTYQCLAMPDDSMAPEIMEGDTVTYNASDTEILTGTGGVYVLDQTDKRTVRNITVTKAGIVIHSVSDNKETLIDKDMVGLIKVLGKVVLVSRAY